MQRAAGWWSPRRVGTDIDERPCRSAGSITRILGGTTDCTASDGACVIGLVRWEQDGTITSVFVPLSFA